MQFKWYMIPAPISFTFIMAVVGALIGCFVFFGAWLLDASWQFKDCVGISATILAAMGANASVDAERRIKKEKLDA